MLQELYAPLIANNPRKTATLSGRSPKSSIVYAALSLLLLAAIIVGASSYSADGEMNGQAFELAHPLP
jgi:hypothetical protein